MYKSGEYWGGESANEGLHILSVPGNKYLFRRNKRNQVWSSGCGNNEFTVKGC